MDRLTNQEIMVLKLLCLGVRKKDIVTRLEISKYTLQAHLRNIYEKLGAANATNAVWIALSSGKLVQRQS